ncbi:hypothetical protein GGR53DRAFT_464724 [Hypoxylon sp. FL1150]|nr:hypothetical protein GGR53DRAFT_464724 [Hypoxylon sp. FL1150]
MASTGPINPMASVNDFSSSGMVVLYNEGHAKPLVFHRIVAMKLSNLFCEEKDDKHTVRHLSYDHLILQQMIRFFYTNTYAFVWVDKAMPRLDRDRAPHVTDTYFRGKHRSLWHDQQMPLARDFIAMYTHPHYKVKTYVRRVIKIQHLDMTDSFLRHARMYKAGKDFQIPRLCEVSSYWLADALVHFEDTWHCVPCVKKLFEYVCANTQLDDPIREMLSMYGACRDFKFSCHTLSRAVYSRLNQDVQEFVDLYKSDEQLREDNLEDRPPKRLEDQPSKR